MDGYKYTTGLLKALAHPIRLQILDVLKQDGESCVCHLECILGYRQAYISQQLSRLREDDLVVDRRDGQNVFYSLADDVIYPLLVMVRTTSETFANRGGITLNFRPLKQDASSQCNCPKCAEITRVAMMSSLSM